MSRGKSIELQLLSSSSNRMKTKEVGEGAGVARSQPEINLRILHRAVQLESTVQKFQLSFKQAWNKDSEPQIHDAFGKEGP